MRTQVFAYKGYVGISSALDAEGLINDPSKPGQLGFVLDLKSVDISPEAKNLLCKIPKVGGSFADIMCWECTDGSTCFGFIGGPKKAFKPQDVTVDRDFTPSLIKPVEIEVPEEFKKFIDFL